MKFDWEMIVAMIIVGVPFLIVIGRILFTKMRGVDAEAVVVRLDESSSTDADGDIWTQTHVYVRYQTQDGRRVEGELANPKNFMSVGDWVTIKYVPGREDNPVLA